jgi:hypothetical protein
MRLCVWVVVVAAGLFAGGCVLHFKGENLEIDAERQRLQRDVEYRLYGMEFAHGFDSQ